MKDILLNIIAAYVVLYVHVTVWKIAYKRGYDDGYRKRIPEPEDVVGLNP